MSTTITLNASTDTVVLGFYGICGENAPADASNHNRVTQRVHLITSEYRDSTGNTTTLQWSEVTTTPSTSRRFYNTDFRHRLKHVYQLGPAALGFDRNFDNQKALYDTYESIFGSAQGGDVDITDASFDARMVQTMDYDRWPAGGGVAGTAWDSGADKTGAADASSGTDFDYYNTTSDQDQLSITGTTHVNNHEFTHLTPGKLYLFIFYRDPAESTITIPELFSVKASTPNSLWRLTDDCQDVVTTMPAEGTTTTTTSTTTSITTSTTTTTTTMPPIGMTDLVAWYKFDGNFNDSSGNDHHLTLVEDSTRITANATTGDAPHMVSYAEFPDSPASIPASGSYSYLKAPAAVGPTFDHDSTDGFTLSMWMKIPGTGHTPPADAGDWSTMTLFSVGDRTTSSANSVPEGFRVQLGNSRICDSGAVTSTDANSKYFLRIVLGDRCEAYADSRKMYNDSGGSVLQWENVGFGAPAGRSGQDGSSTAGRLDDGEWHNVVVTYHPERATSSFGAGGHGAGNSVLVYVDGVRWNNKGASTGHLDHDGTFNRWNTDLPYRVNYSTVDGTNVVTIGDSYQLSAGTHGGDAYVEPYRGLLTDIRIWDRALTDGLENLSDRTQVDTNASTDATGEIECLWNNALSDLTGSHNCS